jgi:Cu/Zn superoxide dismutase
MRNVFRFIVAAAVIALPACAKDENEAYTDAETNPAAEAPAPATPALLMTVPMEAAGGSTVGGEVQILPVENDANAFKVSASFTGVPEGDHAWHIHQGACSAQGTPVVVPFTEDKDKPAIATPITAGADGSATAEVVVPANLLTVTQLRDGDYSLHIHQKTGTDHGPTIGCANL